MLLKTASLTGLALDWAAAKCNQPKNPDGWLMAAKVRQFSASHAEGGPILDRMRIGTVPLRGGSWAAEIGDNCNPSLGPTPLVAGIRCYVTSELGEEIEVPDELCPLH